MGEQILNDEQTVEILEVLMLGVTPAIALFGILGNIFSVIILVKHGLHRSSNILLTWLAVNDIAFLIGFNSVPKFLYEIVEDEPGFRYDRESSYVLFIFYQLFTVMDYGCGAVSMTLPVVITAERLIAVFLPLHFGRIVTTGRTWCAVIFVSIFWYGYFLHMAFYFTLEFEENLNVTVGLLRRSEYHTQNPRTVEILEEAMSYLTIKLPPIFTLVGCVIIGIKIRIASTQRQKMTSKSAKGELSTRTTKMLLAVCAMYTVACSTMSLPTFIPQYMYYSISSDAPSNLGRVLYQVMNIALCINSSCNFIIYVVMNKNFRKTYWSLFRRRSSYSDSIHSDFKK